MLIKEGHSIKGAKLGILGITFNENCADLRNSKVIDIIKELSSYGVEVFIHDPYIKSSEAFCEYAIETFDWNDLPMVDAFVVDVAHKEFLALSPLNFSEKFCSNAILIDVKAIYNPVPFNEF